MNNGQNEKFIGYLKTKILIEDDRAARAALRRSLTFELGTYVTTYPYVEPFVSVDAGEKDARRLALYAIAALFAQHPVDTEPSIAKAIKSLYLKQDKNPSLEKRFITLLGADAQNLMNYLRPMVNLLASGDIGFNYRNLLKDLKIWFNPNFNTDELRQRWARDFYTFSNTEEKENTDTNALSSSLTKNVTA